MLRILLAAVFVMAVTVACGPEPFQAPPSIAFAPTPLEAELGPTPAGLPTVTPIPPPTATAANTATPTSAPTTAGPTQTPTTQPTNTPTVTPNTIVLKASDNGLQPNSVTLKKAEYVKLFIQNQGSSELEFTIQNLKPDTVVADESLAGPVSDDQKSTVDSDASNGTIHLFAMTQGAAAAYFTPTQTGTFPFTIKLGSRQLSGNIIVQ